MNSIFSAPKPNNKNIILKGFKEEGKGSWNNVYHLFYIFSFLSSPMENSNPQI